MVAGDDNIKSDRLRDSVSRFSVGVYSLGYSSDGVILQGSRGFESELLSPWLNLPGVTGFKALSPS